MAFPYKHVLLVGATSGIGKAMADHLIAQGIAVTAVGRRQERLDGFVAEHGSDKASGIAFDIENTQDIPSFIESAFSTHSTIDCVFLNAGTQSRAFFNQPETVDLAIFNRDVTINFTAQVALVHAVLPHLLKHTGPSGLIFTGTPVTIVPAFPMPAYCASKAALEAFLICLREQLRDTNVKVQQISPGPVQSELHPNFGMSLKEFVEETWTALAAGDADIYPGCVGGSTKEQWLELVKVRDAAVARMTGLLRQFMG